MLVQDLREQIQGINHNPVTIPLSDVEVQSDGLHLGDRALLAFDDLTRERLSSFLKLPNSYLGKCPPALQQSNLNYWLNNNDGEASFYTQENRLVGVYDPNKTALPLTTYLGAIDRAFLPHNEVVKFVAEPEYLHVDIVTDAEVEVLGDGSERRPAVGDITKAGLRIIAHPDVDKPPVVSTYLHRLVCTNGLSVPEIAGKITLRSKSPEDIASELENVMVGMIADLQTRLDDYARTAEIPIVGETSHFLYNVATERNLPRAVMNRVIDLGSNLGENPTIYDVTQIFTEVANEDISYRSQLALQGIGGDFVGNTDEMLRRCENCLHPFVNYSTV